MDTEICLVPERPKFDSKFCFSLIFIFWVQWNFDLGTIEYCTLLLNRLLILQIHCCVVGVSNVATEQRSRMSFPSVRKAAAEFGTNNWLNFKLHIFKTEDNWKDETVCVKGEWHGRSLLPHFQLTQFSFQIWRQCGLLID